MAGGTRWRAVAMAYRVWLLLTVAQHVKGVVSRDPIFLAEIQNQTVSEGRNVRFACRVDNLGSHKVAWIHYENSAILTVSNHVITRNDRITVSRDKRQNTYYLHIRNVRETDTGKYMCQINTASAMTIAGYLTVVVPPDIVDNESSNDVIAQEGSDIKLRCRAKGSPRPIVTWKREDGQHIAINKSTTVLEYQGEVLRLSKVNRMDMGAYLCIASNGHPPTVSKRILVSVDFPPMLWIPHQLIGANRGKTVVLECFTEAHPTSLNYWTRGDGNMIYDSMKYRIENRVGNPDYKIHMLLTVRYLEEDDFGTYRCVAKNPRGETDGTIKIYDSGPPPTSPPPPTTEAEVFEKINNQVWDRSENRTRKRPNPQAVSDLNGEGEELDLREQERSLNLPAISPSSGSRGDSHVYLLAGLAGTACLLWARCF
ncbi:lachesin-like isoform X1 [Portunus trituberculatus]|uniref:lachesin-like isoform X1 n=1 Tax=Portunus trituberculatus TaxID=210409 RepID=UPI001E1CC474|nr:lachesin-like isoform X1 [Portunus trituberculatus]XP_045127618.1 lachesin-like isoform X1 [Portunus trituberculatus]XP_045127619.1 lachesin-like isoform X1 [Portunus trituberculatus]XP_045127621.1 lachesin-like isoform X1 [Portunus trituberculatus]XP_045127622.1 lachesin-like isoform X1 [Portunus trituberculatus]